MNGQTGKMIGDMPIGGKEAAIWFFGIFIVAFIIFFFVFGS